MFRVASCSFTGELISAAYNQITTGHLKSIEALTGPLRFEQILVNNICCSSCLVGVAEADLSNGSVLSKDIIHVLCGNLVR